MKNKTPNKISKLKDNEIFVFGSNMNGLHSGGAAKLAKDKFKAEQGIAEGLTGNAYAFPTLDSEMKKQSFTEIEKSADKLLEVVAENQDKHFLITEVGCGIAGFNPEEMAPHFRNFIEIENVSLPEKFIEVINRSKFYKGFKAFDEGMKCKDYQYKENTVVHEDFDPKPCKRGFHFCQEPFDVFNYYSSTPDKVFAEVESIGSALVKRDKVATNKLKIKSKINFWGFFKLAMDRTFDKVEKETSKSTESTASGDEGHASASGNRGHASASGYEGHASASGDYGHASASGYEGHASASGYKGHASASGDYGHASASGDYGHASASGDRGHASASGDRGHASASGNYGHASASGDYGHASASGYKGHASASGDESIAVSIGVKSKVKSKNGWIVLTDWREDEDYNFKIHRVYTAKVGGKLKGIKIKENTWYWFEKGELREKI